jgi:hypothetical protein
VGAPDWQPLQKKTWRSEPTFRRKHRCSAGVGSLRAAKAGFEIFVPVAFKTMANRNLFPWLIAVAFFMETLDTTILNTAVPAISEALHVTPINTKSVLASYTLSLAVFIPIIEKRLND